MHLLTKLAMPWLLCALLALATGTGAVQAQKAPPREVSVAVSQDSPPFYFCEDGQPTGWLVDTWRLWSQATGIKVRFVCAPFGETLRLVGEGKVDIQGGCFYSPERDKYLDYAGELVGTWTTFFHSDEIYGIRGLSDLTPYVIGVIKGDLALEHLRAKLPQATLRVFDSNDAMFSAVAAGQVRVFIKDVPIALYQLGKLGLLNSFSHPPGLRLYSATFSAAVRQGDEAMAELVRRGLAKLTPQQLETVRQRWSSKEEAGGEPVLRIACDRYYPPFSALTASGKPAGLCVDLWRLWSQKTGRKIDFIFGEWSETLDMVRQGAADIHAGLFKTQARQRSLEFSRPYYMVRNALALRRTATSGSLEDLGDKRVGVVSGSAAVDELRASHPKIKVKSYLGYRELLTGLLNGEVTAAYDVEVALREVIQDMDLQGELKVWPAYGHEQQIYGAVRLGRLDLLDAVNKGLAAISRREMAEIEERWVQDPALRSDAQQGRLIFTPAEQRFIATTPPLTFSEVDWKPLSNVDDPEHFRGMIADYLAIITKSSGLRFKFEPSSTWSQVLEKYAQGKLDMIPALGSGDKVGRDILLSEPFATFPLVIVTRDDVNYIKETSELNGRNVAVGRGYTAHHYLRDNYPEIKLKPADDVAQGLLMLSNGEVFAFVGHMAVAIATMQKLGLKNLKIAGETDYRFDHRIGVDPRLAPAVGIINKVLASMDEAQHQAIYRKWLSVEYKKGIDYSLVWQVALGGLLVLGLIFFWNRRLAGEVRQRKTAQARLRESEQRYATITANLPGIVYRRVLEPDGRVTYPYISERIKDYYGLEVEEARQDPQRIFELIHPDDVQPFMDSLRQSAQTLEPWTLDFRILPRGGGLRWLRGRGRVHRGPGGEAIWDSIALDITEERQVRARLEDLAATLPGVIIQLRTKLDGTMEYLYVSPKAESLFGAPPEEVVSRRLLLNWQADDLARLHSEIPEITRQGLEYNFTGRITAPDGQERWLSLVTVPSSREGQWTTHNGFMLDITERKRAELEYQASESKIRAMSEASHDALVMIDAQAHIMFWNHAAEVIFGLTAQEAMGRNLHDLLAPEDERLRAEAGLADFARTGRGPVVGKVLELKALRADGSLFPAEVAVSAFQVGAEWLAVGTIRDLTERKQAEAELRTLSAAVEQSPASVVIANTQGDIEYVNPTFCQVTGYSREEALGHNPRILKSGEHPPEFYKDLWDTVKRKETWNGEMVNRKKSGELFWESVSISPILDENNGVVLYLALKQDITERKRAEQELQRNMEELERFSRLVVGREEKMIELKEEINGLLAELGRQARYKIVQ